MKKLLLILSLTVGILLCIDAIVLLTFTQSIGNILVLCIGLLFIIVGVYYNRFSTTIQKLTKIVMGICIPICLAMISFIAIKGATHNTTYTEDFVIVLGSGLKGDKILLALQKRLDKCVEYINRNPNVIVIVSGGQGMGETIPEALAMERYLLSKGISSTQIIKDDRSTDTYENFKLSKQIIDSLWSNPYREPTIVCITNDYHAYRASKIAQRQNFKVTSYSAALPLYLRPPTYLREILSLFKFWAYR